MSHARDIKKAQSNGCSMYEPCPICFSCMVKATHLYERCANCPVAFCGHNHQKRAMMIRRENFAVTVSPETGEKLKALADQVLRGKEANNERD